jgi:lipoprotein-releasing system ATP-binding protein
MLEAKGLEKSYGSLKVLKGVDLSVRKGEIVSIVGASGAGKSTLLHLLGTLDNPDQGLVTVNGINVFQQQPNALAAFRNKHIGFIFQFHNLLPEFSALENVMIPGFLAGKPDREVKERATALLEDLGLKDRLNHKPSELSGGEQQRTACARALINAPDIILADEPSGNLDSKNAHDLHELFFNLRTKMGQTFIIVTHNQDFANMADRKLEMKDGVLNGR